MVDINIFTINNENYYELARVTVENKIYLFLNNVSKEDEFLIKEYEEETDTLKDIEYSKYMQVLESLKKELENTEVDE